MSETDEIPHVNGHGPIVAGAPALVPEQREPQDAVPPGVWRGPQEPELRPLPQPDDQHEPVPGQAAGGERPRRLVRRVVTHPASRAGARHLVYTAKGARLARQTRRDARGTYRHERMAAAAEARGEHLAAREWLELAATHRRDRHERRLKTIQAVPHMARGVALGAGITLAGLLALGLILAVTSKNPREALIPLRDLFAVIAWTFGVIDALWLPAVLLTPAAVVLSWWDRGRRHADIPAWLMTAEQREGLSDTPITPSIVVTAFRDLGIADLRSAIKRMPDGGAGMLGPIRIAGCGVEVDVLLPSGVPTYEIQARRQKLAENMNRHRHELFISIPPRPRTVRLWIADAGALDQPIGPSPMLDGEVKANYKTGRAPWGQDLRGDAAQVSVFQRHFLVTGASNQGKTASLRALLLWLVFDPRVRVWLADLKGVGDWSMFDGIAEVLIQGPTDEHVMATAHMGEAGVSEMQKRGELMLDLTAQGWTMEKILADPRFAPLVIVIDEAQVAYGCGAIGEDGRPYGGAKNTSRYFQAIKKIHDQGRAVNVTTWEGTQDPTDANLPKRSREGNHVRASLALGTASQSKMALGDAAVDGGAAPHELRLGLDKGTLVVAGDGIPLAPGQTSITVRTHFIGPEDAVRLAEQAKARRKGTVATRDAAEAEPVRDVLADIAGILGDAPRMLSEEALHQLKNLAPQYREWTTATLKGALEPYGAQARPYGGRQHISRARVLDAMAERDANGPQDAEPQP